MTQQNGTTARQSDTMGDQIDKQRINEGKILTKLKEIILEVSNHDYVVYDYMNTFYTISICSPILFLQLQNV